MHSFQKTICGASFFVSSTPTSKQEQQNTKGALPKKDKKVTETAIEEGLPRYVASIVGMLIDCFCNTKDELDQEIGKR